jgi:MtN3 and saliva related transmembrane protein
MVKFRILREQHFGSAVTIGMTFASFDWITVVGAAAAFCSMASFIPQAWKIISSRDTDGLSAPMYVLTISAFGLWLCYGILRNDWALMIPNVICLAVAAFILFMIILPQRKMEKVAEKIEGVVAGD